MTGIYIHIPFCKTKCNYCDFYSKVSVADRPMFSLAVLHELKLRKEYFNGESVDTIYLGGGTPSLLTIQSLEKILTNIKELYVVSPVAEMTIEANPDDLNINYLAELIRIGFNRISIGVQSFSAKELQFLGRRHSAEQAIRGIEDARKVGFTNISIDLIYGLPNSSLPDWKKTLKIACRLKPNHISAYHLTIEEKTPLHKALTSKQFDLISEESSWEQFSVLSEFLREAGYDHYEISNFSLPSFQSKHNSSYWTGKKYLGIGPSAHSFNGTERSWNVSDTHQYIESILNGKSFSSNETLDQSSSYNDFVMTRLRTSVGIDLRELRLKYGQGKVEYCLNIAQNYISSGHIKLDNMRLTATLKGLFISDRIISDLFYVV